MRPDARTTGCSLLLAAGLLLTTTTASAAMVCTTETVGNEDFRGISGATDSHVIAVSKKGDIFRFDGSNWSSMTSPTNEDLDDVEVVDTNTAFAVGEDGVVLQLSGNVWTSIGGFTGEDLNGVWAASATEVYVVGKKGTIYSYDGSTWTNQKSAAGTNNDELEDAWGDANSFYALSKKGELYRYDRITGTWDARDDLCRNGSGFEDLWGDSAGNLYLVRKKQVYRHNGSSCSVVATVSEDLKGIYGSSANGQIYAGGKDGAVAHFDGLTWSESQAGNEEIKDVWVSPAGNAYYAGKKDQITICTNDLPTIVGDWHLDDCTLGFAGSTVVDSGPNGQDGITVGGMVVENDGQLCSAGGFDGTSGYVSVPDSATLDITSGFSVAVWVRHDGAALKNWEAILAKGDSAYRLHLNGGCSISDTLPGNTRHGFTLGLNGGCSGADLNSNVVPIAGTWYHVAATYDRSTIRMFINGNLVNSASYSAAINSNNFDLYIGNNSQRTSRFWSGDIDELTVWDGAITAQQVVTHRDATRPCSGCSSVVLAINHDNFGINCMDESIQVNIIDSLAGTPRIDYAEEITLDTQSGFGSWSLVSGGGVLNDATANDGVATYDWAMGESSATFALTYKEGPSSIDVDAYQSSDTSIRDNDAEGSILFSANGFTLTAAALSNPPPATIVPFSAAQIAGTNVALHVAAFGQTPTDPSCGIIETYTGAQNLKFWSDYVNPGSGSIAVSIDGGLIAGSEMAAGNSAVTFANGQALVTLKYKDVGQIRVNVKDDSLAHPDLANGIRGATSAFDVRPSHFRLTNIENSAGSPNPAAADSSGLIFVPAGEVFSVTVSARDAEDDITPNFGQENIPETVLLTANLVAPLGGDNPPLGSPTGFGAFAAGQATGTSFNWPEVGIITLTPSIGDGSYLGAGDVTGLASGNVGRFSAHHFNSTQSTPAFTTGCPAGSFTYIGETFSYSSSPVITLTARALAGEITENYSGGFFKLDNTSLPDPLYTATPASLDTSGLPTGSSDPGIVDLGAGVATLTFSSGSGLFFSRGAEESPFDANIELSIDVLDADGVTAVSNPISFGSSGGIIFDSGANMRYGRIALRGALGSELVNLAVPMRAEYFVDVNTGFVSNPDDSCSSAVSLSLSNFAGNLSPGDTCVLDSGSPGISGAGCPAPGPATQRFTAPPALGDFNLFLQAPGEGNDGSVSVDANVPSWLRFDWDASTAGDENPSTRATFGIYRGGDRQIYRRELY